MEILRGVLQLEVIFFMLSEWIYGCLIMVVMVIIISSGSVNHTQPKNVFPVCVQI